MADPRGGVDTQRRPDGSRHLLKAVTAAVGNIFAGLGSIVSQTVSGTSGFRFRLPAASVSLKAITGALGSYQPNLLPRLFKTFDISHFTKYGVVSHIIESL